MRVWKGALVWSFGVAVVGAAVYPVFVPVRSREHKVPACLSRVKQLAISLLMYGGDFDERLPQGYRWMDATYDYTKNPVLYRCPLAGKGAWGYAFNSVLALKEPETLGEPAGLALVYDSFKVGKNASDRVTSLPRPGRHEEKNNVAYADGHARAV